MDEHIGETSIAPGTPASPDDIDDAIRLELEFLTALIWAPAPMTTATIGVLTGTPAERQRSDDHLPAATGLFLRPIHETLFATIVTRVDQGLPVTPTLISEGIDDPRDRHALRTLMLEIATPSGPVPPPGGTAVPHLAVALIDRWYRRGYAGLLSRMGLAVEESPTADLADHWSSLTTHQQRAHHRWSVIRERLLEL